MKVAVVILNWNGKSFLEKFLPPLVEHNTPDSEIIIADNASTDDSLEFLKEYYPQLKVIKNSVNGGFAKGYNDALQHVKAEYYVLLNSDIEVSANWITPIIELMDKDKTIAACQPKIKDYNRKTHFEYAGAAGGYIDKYGYPFCRGRIFDTLEEDKKQYDDVAEIFWATGACLFIRADCYHQMKGFDEDFFAHMEEIDLCWRLKNYGYKIMYCSQSTVYHVGGGTLNKINPYKTYLNFRNNLVLLFKNHAPSYFYVKIFIRMVLDGIAGVKFLISGQASHCTAILKAHFSFYASFRKTLNKRKKMKAEIKQYATQGVLTQSIIVSYYLKGIKKFTELKF
ncbi:MAG: glycosyltransferase family 2 protein [Bacteroidia bacterium]